jgi:hypothetical protein
MPWLSVADIDTRMYITVGRRPWLGCNGEFSSILCLMVSGMADVHLANVGTEIGRSHA